MDSWEKRMNLLLFVWRTALCLWDLKKACDSLTKEEHVVVYEEVDKRMSVNVRAMQYIYKDTATVVRCAVVLQLHCCYQ